MVADTSFIHSTSNHSAEKDRFVLIVRFWHPAGAYTRSLFSST